MVYPQQQLLVYFSLYVSSISSMIFNSLQVFDLFDERKNGFIEFDEFVHALAIFHPCTSIDKKIDCKC